MTIAARRVKAVRRTGRAIQLRPRSTRTAAIPAIVRTPNSASRAADQGTIRSSPVAESRADDHNRSASVLSVTKRSLVDIVRSRCYDTPKAMRNTSSSSGQYRALYACWTAAEAGTKAFQWPSVHSRSERVIRHRLIAERRWITKVEGGLFAFTDEGRLEVKSLVDKLGPPEIPSNPAPDPNRTDPSNLIGAQSARRMTIYLTDLLTQTRELQDNVRRIARDTLLIARDAGLLYDQTKTIDERRTNK
jgi:hypothetical protein